MIVLSDFTKGYIYIQWLSYMVIHTVSQAFPHILYKGIGSHGYDRNTVGICQSGLPDVVSGLITVEQRHTDIHQYHVKGTSRAVGIGLYCLVAIDSAGHLCSCLF